MKRFAFFVFQTVFALILIALAFAPEWGLFYWAVNNFGNYTYPIVLVGSIWWILLSLNFPLSRTQFQWASGIGVLAIIVGSTWKLYETGNFDISSKNSWIWFAIFFSGLMLGWLTISSKIYREYRHILGVDDADTGDE